MKQKKTYRLRSETVHSISVLKDAMADLSGTNLSDGQVIEMAVRTLYKEFEDQHIVPAYDDLDKDKIEALKGEFGDDI